ncbi:LysR family transcriptional regulator [Bordetella genomosp. 9]|uniref:LysR family transcriptional regulator n=1 Tax=Bordetella genomosp. 9 TaxID=1416803 RepID=UPI000A28F9BF|nr:LysR family transcriptional regulator [Bordetella genomosp. 9]ARP89652.1 LysR family transcriptional regulator [Bordetella genomosp. 9]
MPPFTLQDLRCFDAVVREGGFQAAALALHRTHPAVFAAVARLERQVGFALLDRSGYRVRLTAAGRAFHRQAQSLLLEWHALQAHAEQLAMGEEAELRVVMGDLCPPAATLRLLAPFFAGHPATRWHLDVEAVTGPWERLLEGDADLILHRIEKSDTRIEWLDLCKVELIPVVAPGFLPFPLSRHIKPEQLRNLAQCVVRDSARRPSPQEHFVIPGAPQYTVPDPGMKKEIIMQGMAWGHLPHFLVERELQEGTLVSIAGRHLPGRVEQLVAARHRDRPHGPVADRLWEYLRQAAPQLQDAAVRGRPAQSPRHAASKRNHRR